MKFGVVVFPGSNCDHDTYHVLNHVLGQETVLVWHRDTDLHDIDAVIIPGGFSYGDYLRCGAIAKFSPVMQSVRRHAESGKLLLGICNGFQILQEASMLPGVMLRNAGLKFVCEHVYLRTENDQVPFTRGCEKGQLLKMPVAHNEGNFFISPAGLDELKKNGQILFRYSDSQGRVTREASPNGALENIAGVSNRQGNIMGLMSHPERASESSLGSQDGLFLFRSMVESCRLASI